VEFRAARGAELALDIRSARAELGRGVIHLDLSVVEATTDLSGAILQLEFLEAPSTRILEEFGNADIAVALIVGNELHNLPVQFLWKRHGGVGLSCVRLRQEGTGPSQVPRLK